MKMLWTVWLYVFMSIATAAQTDQVEGKAIGTPVLDLKDCKIMKIFARVWKYYPLVEKERAVWIVVNSSGQYESIDWLRSPQRSITVWSDLLPDHVVAQAHTHSDHVEPRPSRQDLSVARHLNIAIYTLARKGIWRATPEGEIIQEATRGWYDRTTRQCTE